MVSASTLLQIWEQVQCAAPADRSIRLLALALPGVDRETIDRFDLGLRDWHLLRLRVSLFGRSVVAWTDCPACGERLEVEFDASAVDRRDPTEAPVYTNRAGRRFRLPNVGDLSAIAGIEDRGAAARCLFERCSLDGSSTADGPSVDFDDVDERLESLAADRAVDLNLTCPHCGRPSRHILDAGDFLWTEIESQAASLLDDVHRLASAYNWTERDILAMSAARRAAYLNRVN